MGLSYMLLFMAGAMSTGAVVAMTIVVRKLSAIPPATLPIVFAVAGAMMTISALALTSMWSIVASVMGANISVRVIFSDKVVKLRGVTNSVAARLITG